MMFVTTIARMKTLSWRLDLPRYSLEGWVSVQKRRQGGGGAVAMPPYSFQWSSQFQSNLSASCFHRWTFWCQIFGCFQERSGRPTTTSETTTAASGANNRGGWALSPSGSWNTWPLSLLWSSLAPQSPFCLCHCDTREFRGHLTTASLLNSDLSSTLRLCCYIDDHGGTMYNVNGDCDLVAMKQEFYRLHGNALKRNMGFYGNPGLCSLRPLDLEWPRMGRWPHSGWRPPTLWGPNVS